MTPVRGQGICGSCYALGAVGAVEGAYFMKVRFISIAKNDREKASGKLCDKFQLWIVFRTIALAAASAPLVFKPLALVPSYFQWV